MTGPRPRKAPAKATANRPFPKIAKSFQLRKNQTTLITSDTYRDKTNRKAWVSMKSVREQVMVNGEEVDLSRSQVHPSLSGTAFDESNQTFFVTFDMILFQKAYEVIHKVLEANGYVNNIENLLACLDTMVFAARVKLQPKERDHPRPSPKTYFPCVQFQLPSKTKVGPLLKQFYREIESYEEELSRLRGAEPSQDGKKVTITELREEIRELKRQQRELKAENRELQSRLSQASKSAANAEKTIASQNLLPPQIRLAKVREVSLEDRLITLKSARATFSLSMFEINRLPQVGENCLVQIENGTLRGAFFFEGEDRALKGQLASVLFTTHEECKVRDINRSTWVIRAKNDFEKKTFARLKRGSQIMMYQAEGHFIRLHSIDLQDHRRFYNKTLEKIASQQITANQLETPGQADQTQSFQDQSGQED